MLLLVAVAAMGVASAASVSLGHAVIRRAAEQELLLVGEELRQALLSWRAAGLAGPDELQDLLRDTRSAAIVRHLRRIPADPLTGRQAWGLVRDASHAIVGVHSLAPGRPIKRDAFEAISQRGFAEADSYAQWVFGVGPR